MLLDLNFWFHVPYSKRTWESEVIPWKNSCLVRLVRGHGDGLNETVCQTRISGTLWLWGGGGYPRNADIIVNWVSVQNKLCTIYVVYHNQWFCIYKYIHRNTVYHCVRCWSKGKQATNIEIDVTRGIKSWFDENLKRKNTCLTKPVVSCAAWWGWTLLSVLCVLGRYMYII